MQGNRLQFGKDGAPVKCGPNIYYEFGGGKKGRWSRDSGLFLFRDAIPKERLEKVAPALDDKVGSVGWGVGGGWDEAKGMYVEEDLSEAYNTKVLYTEGKESFEKVGAPIHQGGWPKICLDLRPGCLTFCGNCVSDEQRGCAQIFRAGAFIEERGWNESPEDALKRMKVEASNVKRSIRLGRYEEDGVGSVSDVVASTLTKRVEYVDNEALGKRPCLTSGNSYHTLAPWHVDLPGALYSMPAGETGGGGMVGRPNEHDFYYFANPPTNRIFMWGILLLLMFRVLHLAGCMGCGCWGTGRHACCVWTRHRACRRNQGRVA